MNQGGEVAPLRLARRISNIAVLGAVFGFVAWQVASRGPGIVGYWRDVAMVKRAERALEKGDRWLALQVLGQAGKPGEERLGRLLVACHNQEHWPQLVADLERSWPATHDAVARTLGLSPEESLCAAEALAALGDKRGVRVLSAQLIGPTKGAHPPDELVTLGEAGAMALVNVARSGPVRARRQALLLLGGTQALGAQLPLIDLLTDHRFPYRYLALRALSREASVGVALRHYLTDPDPLVRAEAVQQYAARKGTEALPALAEALDDEDSRVRLDAVEALCTIEDPEANRLLVRALSDSDPDVVRRAVCSLGRRRAHEAVPALETVYARGSRSLRRDVATALCWMDSPLAPKYKALWEQETGQRLVLSSAWDG